MRRPIAILAFILGLSFAIGCGSGSPTKPLASVTEVKVKEQGTKAAPND